MEKELETATMIANMLDNRFSILGIRFGINAIVDLVPELGDIIAAIFSSYIILLAFKYRLPTFRIIQMLLNIFINFIVGLIPIFGDMIYIINKANIKNLNILKKHIQSANSLQVVP